MKISIKDLDIIPKNVDERFGFCFFGENIPESITTWIVEHGFYTEITGKYLNIFPVDEGLIRFDDLFYDVSFEPFKYLDGFSPNLNKKLHIGHFSNLVLAKAFKSLGIAKISVAILGDTLNKVDETFEQVDAYKELHAYLFSFDYEYGRVYYASTMGRYPEAAQLELTEGEDKYVGTKIFDLGEEEKIVGIKSDGTTSYFYQDAVLAKILNGKTLYLTGNEQKQHFESLKKLYPHTHHIGLGLVKVNGNKMASRIGNVILMEDFIKDMMSEFDNDMDLCYNIFAGFILRSKPDKDKLLNLDHLSNRKNSYGLYISYTMARLYSAGLEFKIQNKNKFYSPHLEYNFIMSCKELSPNKLFNALFEHCEKISYLYGKYRISDNEENKETFSKLLSDLLLAANYLGLFWIKKV